MRRILSHSRWLLALSLVCLATAANLRAEEGILKTKVNPSRAGVFVDGQYVGPARDFTFVRWYRLPAGDHQITLRDPRYKEYSTNIKIESGKTTVLSVGLDPVPVANPPFGTLKTHSKDRFNPVFVNTYFVGHVDEFDNFVQGLLLPPGEYEVMIQSPEGKEFKQKVKIETNKTTTVTAPF